MLRKPLLVLGPVVALVLGSLAACDDEIGAGNLGIGDLDASFDATTTPPATLDAGQADAEPQTPPDAVVVAITGATIAGVPVVFHDADGAVLETLTTGADGRATSTKPTIAMVTALQKLGTINRAVTWMGVKLGERLTLKDLVPLGDVGTFDVSSAYVDGFARTWTAYSGPCSVSGSVAGAQALALNTSCIGATPSAVLVRSAGTAPQPYRFTKTGPTAPTDGSTVAVTVPTAALAPSTTALSVTSFEITGDIYANDASIAGGLLFAPEPPKLLDRSTVAGTTASTGLYYPTSFGEALQATVSFTPKGALGTQTLVKRHAPGAAVTFDQKQVLPAITGGSAPDGTDPLRPVLAWTGNTAATDGGVIVLGMVYRGAPTRAVGWTFVVPPGTTTLKAPALPVDSDFLPAGQPLFGGPSIQFFESDAFADAAAFRQEQGAFFGPYRGLAVATPVLATDAQLRTTSLTVGTAH